jgi:hypothetical protein
MGNQLGEYMAEKTELNKFLEFLVNGQKMPALTRRLVLLVEEGKLSAESAQQLLKEVAENLTAPPASEQVAQGRKSRRIGKAEAEESRRTERLKGRTLPSGDVLPRPLLSGYKGGPRVRQFKRVRRIFARHRQGEPIPELLSTADEWHAQGLQFSFSDWPSSQLLPLLLLLEIPAQNWHYKDWAYFKEHRADFPEVVKGERELLDLEVKAQQKAA